MPLSCTRDAVGPIAKYIANITAILNVIASVDYDKEDDFTALRACGMVDKDYTALLGQGSLSGIRLGECCSSSRLR